MLVVLATFIANQTKRGIGPILPELAPTSEQHSNPSADNQLMIIHTEQKQPVWRGRRPGLSPRPGLEQRGHVFGFAPATAHFDEGPDNRSHHVTEEAVS